jgi:mono/diheme cytochrome c family protein
MLQNYKSAVCILPFQLTCVGLLFATTLSAEESEVASQTEQSNAVHSILASHCSDCHAGEELEGEFDLRPLLSALKNGEKLDATRSEWGRVFTVLVTNQMPPEDADHLHRNNRTKVVAWLKSQLPDVGAISDWEHKLLSPEYGNYVDHDSLFDGSVEEVAWSPARLWKKSAYIFDSLADRGIGFRAGRGRSPHLSTVKQPFTMEDRAGVKDFAAIMMADSATLGTMIRNAEVIVDKHFAGAMHELDERINGPTPEDQLPKDKNGKPIRPRFETTPKEFAEVILSEEPASTEQVHAAIEKMFQLMIERSATPEELLKYQRLMYECAKRGGQAEGLRMALIAIAVSPPAVYRTEFGQGEIDQNGRQMLSPADLAFAIAYALTDQRPDDQLLEAAKSGRLSTREDVAREVMRYWDDETIEKPRVLRFFHEFFGYHVAPGVFKDVSRFKHDYRNVPDHLVQDADTLVKYIVKQDRNVLAELLTTDKYFVSHSGDNKIEHENHDALQKFYDYYKDKPWREFPYAVPKEHMTEVRSYHRMFTHANGNVTKRWMNYLTRCDEAGIRHMPMQNGREYISAYSLDEKTFDYPVEQPFSLAPKQRIGILMHPAWLIAHSLNLDNDPVRRGKWIRERLLADTVPELPITVDASIPEAPEQTLRQRFAVTRRDECWRCHVKMNPLGMPFELFDDFGRYRKVEALHAKGKTAPVDASGALVGSQDKELDGDVKDSIELVRRLAKSERVRQSFVRHGFRYWMGRNEMLSDSSTLIAADKAYVDSDGSFRALVISLLTSDSFIYRKQ